MFDAKIEKDKIVKFIRDYFNKNNLGGVVIGISGGKDSGVVAGLFTEALGPENVLGVTLPCHSKEQDRKGAEIIANHYGFELINLDLTSTFEAFVSNEYFVNLPDEVYLKHQFENSDINLKPRLRMAACYYMTALLSAMRGGL